MRQVEPSLKTLAEARARGVQIVPHGDVWDLRDSRTNRELGHFCTTTRHGRILGEPPRKFRCFAQLLYDLRPKQR